MHRGSLPPPKVALQRRSKHYRRRLAWKARRALRAIRCTAIERQRRPSLASPVARLNQVACRFKTCLARCTLRILRCAETADFILVKFTRPVTASSASQNYGAPVTIFLILASNLCMTGGKTRNKPALSRCSLLPFNNSMSVAIS